jgi:hypothetical protein
MVKWKCLHTKTTSAKKCIDLEHRDCLITMCEQYDILEIEKIKINFDKNSVGNRFNNSDVDILSYMCELSDYGTIKFLMEEKKYNPNNNHYPLRGYEYLLSSICYGNNFDIFLYIYDHALENGIKLTDLTYPCMYGNMDILKYMYDNMTKKERYVNVPTDGLFHAIIRNHVKIVNFLFDKYDLELDEIFMLSYARFANLKMWKLLTKKKNVTITEKMILYAKKYNDDKEVYMFMNNKKYNVNII